MAAMATTTVLCMEAETVARHVATTTGEGLRHPTLHDNHNGAMIEIGIAFLPHRMVMASLHLQHISRAVLT